MKNKNTRIGRVVSICSYHNLIYAALFLFSFDAKQIDIVSVCIFYQPLSWRHGRLAGFLILEIIELVFRFQFIYKIHI